jgi:hypothetical protein
MNVTALRAELAALERDGYGDCSVEVWPDEGCDGDGGTFVMRRTHDYEVDAIHIPGPPHEGYVSLLFAQVEPDEA